MSAIHIHKNKRRLHPARKLAILVPFYHDSPVRLIRDLSANIRAFGLEKDVALYLYDDGTGEARLTEEIVQAVNDFPAPARLLTNPANHGRSFARNQLKDTASASWMLFLDSDMGTARDDFLKSYLGLIAAEAAPVIFGGFQVPDSADEPARELHRVLSLTSDCLSAEDRRRHGPQHVATSNLCVRRDVLEAEPFDTGFSGWGWEDSEWAARASRRFEILHADIPAIHYGLETTETLLNRFRDSAGNYAKFTALHPELAKSLTLYKLARNLKRTPGQKLARPALKLIARAQIIPMKLRIFALKLWRASWYAEAVQ